MRTEDGHIIRKCLDGDKAAFGLLVDKYKASIYALAYSKLRNYHDAEDVIQEAFVKAYRNLYTLRWWDSFLPWLYAITSNLCKNRIRWQSQRLDREFIADQSADVLNRGSLDSYRQTALLESLGESLDSMPETYRQVVVLYYLGNLSTREIARFLGTSPNAIAQRLRRARTKLKGEMIAMMNDTHQQNRLREGFTFQIVEIIKRIRIRPAPRAPWLPMGASGVTGIIIAALCFTAPLSSSDAIRIGPTAPGIKGQTEETPAYNDIPVTLVALSEEDSQSKMKGFVGRSPSVQRLVQASQDTGERLGQLELVMQHFIQRQESLRKQQDVLMEELRVQLAELQQLRGTPGITRTTTSIPRVRQAQRPTLVLAPRVLFADRFNVYIDPPVGREERLLSNGDFEADLGGWGKRLLKDERRDSVMTCEVVYDEDIQSNVVEFKRTGGGTSGMPLGLDQDLYIDLSKYKEVCLQLDVKPVFQSLSGGGWAGGAEYPVTVQIAFFDQRDERQLWSHGFYYKDTSDYDDATKVERGAWFTFRSPNLKEVKPDCADEKLVSDGQRWGRNVRRYIDPVVPKTITRIVVFGAGWDYTGRADNIQFVLIPDAEVNPDE